MTRITYLGHETGEDGFVRWHGHAFRPREAVEVNHPALIEAAKGNPNFSVEDGEEPEADEPDEEFGAYEVKRRARGRFAVFKGDAIVADGLTKVEAETHARDLASADEAANG